MQLQPHSLFICLLFCVACADDEASTNELLVGKWKLTETYDGYANGGSSVWADQPADLLETVEFTRNGLYAQRIETPTLVQECTGSYKVKSRKLVQLETSCQTIPVQLKISELNRTTLIIDYQGFEGVIRYKYTLVR